MPRGIPNEKETNGRKVLSVALNDAEYDKLMKIAADQYRTPQLQAGWLLKQVLAQVNGLDTTAEKIIARAHSRATGEA